MPEITLSTEKGFHRHSYVLDVDNIQFTDTGTMMIRLPKRSNTKEIASMLNRVKNDRSPEVA